MIFGDPDSLRIGEKVILIGNPYNGLPFIFCKGKGIIDRNHRLGTFTEDIENERLIKTAKMTYSFENTMYGTLGPERTVWDEEADKVRQEAMQKSK